VRCDVTCDALVSNLDYACQLHILAAYDSPSEKCFHSDCLGPLAAEFVEHETAVFIDEP
jgi:hypothetical protein